MNTWSIYALHHPDTKELRYVGFSNNPRRRLGAHLLSAARKDTPRACWIWALLESGKRPSVSILEVGIPTRRIAGVIESKWIARLRFDGYRLLNSTEGGDGVFGLSSHGREKLRLSRLGKTASEQTRARMRESAKGRPPVSPETLAKRRASLRIAAFRNPDAIARATERIRNVRPPLESILRVCAANRGRKRSAEAKAKTAATLAAKRKAVA